MNEATDIVYEFDTAYGHYMVIDMIYDDRPARVLFSGDRQAAQSGLARDDKPELLFDYNQRLFELVVGMRPLQVLLIGGGMFTLPTALLKVLPDVHIDIVELDDGLRPVATRYFELPDDSRLTVIHDDGINYLQRREKRYDIVLLDAYAHDIAAPALTSPEAIISMRDSLKPGGLVAANIITAYYGRRAQHLRQTIKAYDGHFAGVKLFPASQGQSLWLPQNLLLIAQADADTPVDEWMRYQRIEFGNSPFNAATDLR